MATQSQGKPMTQRNYGNQPVSYGIRVGNLFVIELSKEMLADNGSDKTYFHQCLEAYINILKKKLSRNAEDWMGLIVCRANKKATDLDNSTDDSNPEPDGVLPIQKFSLVDTNMFFQINKMDKEGIEYWKNLYSDDDCSIGDVLMHAARTINSVKKQMASRRVIFITCNDNPCANDAAERNRIRVNLVSFKDLDIKLQVIGMGDDFDYYRFYKEVEMLSDHSTARDFRKIELKELEAEIIHRTHILGHLDFRFQPNLTVRVSIQNFSKKRKTLAEIPADKTTNEPLDRFSWWTYDQSVMDDTESQFDMSMTQHEPGEVKKVITYGQRDIIFSPDEVVKMRYMLPRGIDLLGFKPKEPRDPMFQIHHPFFVGCHSAATKGEMELFAALISRMEAKNVKAICAVTTRKVGPTKLFEMWPCTKYGGFYIMRLPYKDDERDTLDDIIRKFIYSTDNEAPINNNDVTLVKNIVKKLYFTYSPELFDNPRLQRQMQYVQNIALEMPPMEPPVDTTLPPEEDINERLRSSDLIEQYKNNFGSNEYQDTNKIKRLDEEWVKTTIVGQQLDKFTVVVLKSMLKTLDLSVNGKKQELIERLKEYGVKNLRKSK